MTPLRRLRIATLVWVGSAAFVGGARAQDVTVRSYVTPDREVAVGSTFTVNLEINGSQSLAETPAPPNLDAFARYLGSGTSSSMQVAGGRTSVSLTVQFRYQATESGSHPIPAISADVGGEELTTEPTSVTVVQAAQSGSPSTSPSPGSSTGPEVGPDDIFVTVEVSKTNVRVGEPLIAEYRIWTRVDVNSYSLTSVPEPEGFWAEELDVPNQQVEQVTRDGQPYATAVIRRVALVPTGAGTRTVGPLGVEAQVRIRRQMDPFDGFFGRRSLFGSTVTPHTVLSDPLSITVTGLPEGQPEPFSGVVGSLEITASLDRDTVDTNDAVTLTVRVQGEGNVRTIPAPELDLPDDFEVFPPEISESVRPTSSGLSGARTFEYVMIPRAPGNRAVPAVEMAYFDTRSGTYRIASSDEIPLTVVGTSPEGPMTAARGGVTTLREDIRFIRLGSSSLRARRRSLGSGSTFWIIFLLPMIAAAGAMGLRRHQDRLHGDVAYARSRRASKVARRRLAKANGLVEASEPRAFYAEVARSLRGFIADSLNTAEAGMQTAEIARSLEGCGVPDATVRDVSECLDRCDRERFAPTDSGVAERRELLDKVTELMAGLSVSIHPRQRR